MNELKKPVVGFTTGDLNGIGLELIIKSLADTRILDICIPVVFASNKSVNFYKKSLGDINFSYTVCKDFTKLNEKQVNIFACWEEEVVITPGQMNELGGKYAYLSLKQGVESLKAKDIDALITAPIHKSNIQSAEFKHSGHTPYLKEAFEVNDVLMLMVADNMRVGLVTEHLPIAEVSKAITKDAILSKLRILSVTLKRDFGVNKPRIAVLGLNPHTGDNGLIGNEEETIIKPAVKEARNHALIFGPYSADAFFARAEYEKFDGVLAMYHDQGLIPFKSLANGEGVNYTAGLEGIRTSPDHGTAFDIAGKNIADHASFLAAIFEAIDIYRRRAGYESARENPLKKLSARFFANAVDERLDEN